MSIKHPHEDRGALYIYVMAESGTDDKKKKDTLKKRGGMFQYVGALVSGIRSGVAEKGRDSNVITRTMGVATGAVMSMAGFVANNILGDRVMAPVSQLATSVFSTIKSVWKLANSAVGVLWDSTMFILSIPIKIFGIFPIIAGSLVFYLKSKLMDEENFFTRIVDSIASMTVTTAKKVDTFLSQFEWYNSFKNAVKEKFPGIIKWFKEEGPKIKENISSIFKTSGEVLKTIAGSFSKAMILYKNAILGSRYEVNKKRVEEEINRAKKREHTGVAWEEGKPKAQLLKERLNLHSAEVDSRTTSSTQFNVYYSEAIKKVVATSIKSYVDKMLEGTSVHANGVSVTLDTFAGDKYKEGISAQLYVNVDVENNNKEKSTIKLMLPRVNIETEGIRKKTALYKGAQNVIDSAINEITNNGDNLIVEVSNGWLSDMLEKTIARAHLASGAVATAYTGGNVFVLSGVFTSIAGLGWHMGEGDILGPNVSPERITNRANSVKEEWRKKQKDVVISDAKKAAQFAAPTEEEFLEKGITEEEASYLLKHQDAAPKQLMNSIFYLDNPRPTTKAYGIF